LKEKEDAETHPPFKHNFKLLFFDYFFQSNGRKGTLLSQIIHAIDTEIACFWKFL